MKNKYILILNADKLTKSVYEKHFRAESYDIIVDEGNMFFVKKIENEQTNFKYEKYIIDITISIIKKYKIDKFIYMNFTNRFNDIFNKISKEEAVNQIDNRITWAVRQEIVRILINKSYKSLF